MRVTKKLLAVLGIFLTLGALAKDGFQLTIKIAGMPKQKLLLGYYYGDKQYIRDSAFTDATGKAIFKGDEKLEGGIYLIASPTKQLLFDFVVTEQIFSLETDTIDYIDHMVIKGSPENDAFFSYSKFTNKAGKEAVAAEQKMKAAQMENDTAKLRKYREEIRSIEMSVIDYRNKMVVEKPNMLISKIFKMMKEIDVPEPPKDANGIVTDSLFQYNYYRKHYFDNVDLTDDRLVRTPVFHGRIVSYMTKVTPQIPDTIIAAADLLIAKTLKSKEVSKWVIYWITNYYETSQYMGMDAVFVHLVKTYYNDTTITYWVDDATRYKITDRANTLGYNLLGKKAQNLSLPDTAGKYQTLYNINAEYTVVAFWDATCGKCKEEMPKLKLLVDSLNQANPIKAGKKIEVYALSMTVEPNDWIKFIKEKNLNFIHVYDPYRESNFRTYYDVYSTPVIYLLGRQKKIIAKRLSVEQLQDFINRGITEDMP